MGNTTQPVKDIYSEQEAADILGISVPLLHKLLDDHIFNDGVPRPERVQFTSSDLVLIDFWREGTPNPKLLRMPRRR